jgi:hypothetical protein
LLFGHARLKHPEVEPTIALPGGGIAWDVVGGIGHRRFSRHWSIPQIRGELHDRFAIDLTEPGIAKYIGRYQAMRAARQQDPEALRQHYQGTEALILSIDGLQPEKGHETLYVVRERVGKRVWFAEALRSAPASEVRRLIAARLSGGGGPGQVGHAVDLGHSRTPSSPASPRSSPTCHSVLPTISSATWPSRCSRPTTHARVRWQKVRGGDRAVGAEPTPRRRCGEVPSASPESMATEDTGRVDPAGDVVRDDCAAVRGILNPQR